MAFKSSDNKAQLRVNEVEQGSRTTGIDSGAVGTSRLDVTDHFDSGIEDGDNPIVDTRTRSTRQDASNMHRMGKKQEFIRHFQGVSATALGVVACAAWQLNVFLIEPGLVDGGTPSLFWGGIISFFMFFPIYLSMAEMSSMAPISGGQFHWVSEFAPAKYQKILSYITGWTSTLAWQAGQALGPILVGLLIQTMILVGIPDYSYPRWHGALLSVAACLVNYCINVYGAKTLPYWQTFIMILIFGSFLAFLIPLWVNAPKAPTHQVLYNLTNSGDWSTMSLAVLAGQQASIGLNIGADVACHMAEDVRNASRNVPLALLWTFLFNFTCSFAAVATLCFSFTDVAAALDDATGYPAVWALRQAMSSGWVIVEIAIIDFLIMCGNVSYMAAVTRDLFAFARDDGLPFSKWLSTVHPKRLIPENAIKVTTGISIALSLLYIGSPVALYAVTSLCTVSLLQCYVFSIGCVLWRRINYPETLPPTQFSLGRLGIAINVIAIVMCVYGWFFLFWPIYGNPDASTLNWAAPVFSAVIIGSLVYYFFKARHVYTGPVAKVVGRGDIELL